MMMRPGCLLCLGGAWLGRVEFLSFDREERESHERGSGSGVDGIAGLGAEVGIVVLGSCCRSSRVVAPS